MKVVGLITEYNPFHNGHRYHIEEAKKKTGADFVIVVMSGNFVQRGAPALIDKYSRTKMALAGGADVVFELPVCFSSASAEYFALGAVSLLDKLGIIDSICFGSECGDLYPLWKAAEILTEEPEIFSENLSLSVKGGMTFPAARMEALKSVLPQDNDTFSLPNNILGIEYMKALMRLNSSIKPVTITRVMSAYHDKELTADKESTISSATAIRKALSEKAQMASLVHHVPGSVYTIMEEEYQRIFPIFEDDFSLLLNYKLLQESESTLTRYTDMTTDLANRIASLNTYGLSYTQIAQEVKAKHWTLTRINRVLLHLLLNLYTQNFLEYKEQGFSQYARLLGFKKDSSHLLREIQNKDQIPVLTKLADAPKQLNSTGLAMLKEDIFAAEIYNHVVFNKFGTKIKDEYTHGVVIL